MIDVIEYNGKKYPKYETEGNAARFIMPVALQFCKGIGYDIGCNRLEWAMPASIPVDPNIDPEYHATRLPYGHQMDFIFSSHCLEHVNEPWYGVLEYWKNSVKDGGVIFQYLPHYSQEYWRPWNNRKHIHTFTPEMMKDAFESLGMINVFHSERDLNDSFAIVGEVKHG